LNVFFIRLVRRDAGETTVNSEEEAFFTRKNLLFSSPASRSCHQIWGAFFFLALSRSDDQRAATKTLLRPRVSRRCCFSVRVVTACKAARRVKEERGTFSPSCEFFLPYLKNISDTLLFSYHTTNKNRLLKSSQKKKPCAT
jgi:hypothetical protein